MPNKPPPNAPAPKAPSWYYLDLGFKLFTAFFTKSELSAWLTNDFRSMGYLLWY